MSDSTIKNLNYSLNGQNVNYLRNFKLDTVDTDPTATSENQLKLNTNDNRLKYHDGTEVKTIALLSDVDIDTNNLVLSEAKSLAVLPADTETEVTFDNFTFVLLAAITIGSPAEDITSSLIVKYISNRVILQSSVELTNLTINAIGKKVELSINIPIGVAN